MSDYTEYPTPEAKADELRTWEEVKAGPRGKGGQGFPDDRIIPLVDALNALPGVCTLGSCAGHPGERRTDADGVTELWNRYAANLWLWLDWKVYRRFLRTAPDFVQSTVIRSVSVLFGRWDRRAIVDIEFAGDDVGEGALEESSELILEYFRSIARRPDGDLQDIWNGSD